MTPLSILSWLAFSKFGRIVLIVISSLVGYLGFSQYYKHEGRKQVYEKIEKETRKAKDNRNEIENRTNSTSDDALDKWLRNRGSDE